MLRQTRTHSLCFQHLCCPTPVLCCRAATSLAAQRLIENHLMWAAYYFTWTIDEVWNRWYLTAFDDLPAWLMFVVPGHVRKRVTRDLEGQVCGHTVD